MRITRRTSLRLLASLGIPFAGCAVETEDPSLWPEADLPWDDVPGLTDPPENERLEVEALLETLLPAKVDAAGLVLEPGALEVRAFDVMRVRRFVPLLQSRGLLPRGVVAGEDLENTDGLDAALRGVLYADLQLRASGRAPGANFRDLSREVRATLVDEAFGDPRTRGVYEVARAACMIAFLGAIYTDVGLVSLGYPPFIDRQGRIANDGYPRTAAGPILDTNAVNMARLQASGELDHYSYNRRPEPTPGQDLSTILDARGDLL